ncbi:MAG: superoxide dismutase [Caldithrix sp.]|nr:superoxide dismutase [Caldithrix sp.]
MKKMYAIMLSLIFLAAAVQHSRAHCEIPCGIYGDKMRIDMLNEHLDTIEKSMNMIMELQKANTVNYNQLVRWITNKESHANEFQHIVTQYFMTQRIKLVDNNDVEKQKKYTSEVTMLHEMLVYAMKTKQTTDLNHVKTLRDLVKKFSKSYFSEADLKHLKEHKD